MVEQSTAGGVGFLLQPLRLIRRGKGEPLPAIGDGIGHQSVAIGRHIGPFSRKIRQRSVATIIGIGCAGSQQGRPHRHKENLSHPQ